MTCYNNTLHIITVHTIQFISDFSHVICEGRRDAGDTMRNLSNHLVAIECIGRNIPHEKFSSINCQQIFTIIKYS